LKRHRLTGSLVAEFIVSDGEEMETEYDFGADTWSALWLLASVAQVHSIP